MLTLNVLASLVLNSHLVRWGRDVGGQRTVPWFDLSVAHRGTPTVDP